MAFNLGARMTSRSHRKTRPEPACRDDTGLHLVPPGLGLVMLLLGVLIVVAEGSALAPFIYTIF